MKRLELVKDKFIEQVLLLGVKSLILADIKHRYYGPVHGSEMTPELKNQLLEFRNGVFGDQFEYLRSETQKKIEADLQLDERSYHFYSKDWNNKIVGALRLTPPPYEFSALTKELEEAAGSYQNIFEISRYMTQRKKHIVAQLILFHSGSWIIKNTAMRGMLALSKEKLKEHYRMYGVKDEDIQGPFKITWRSDKEDYYLVTADLRKITRTIIERFVFRVKK